MTDSTRPTDPTCDDVREMAGSFVLGALPDTQMAAIRAHLESCPDAHEEIAALGSVLPVLDVSVPVVEPPVALKGRILAAAAADLSGAMPSARPTVAAGLPAQAIAPAPGLSAGEALEPTIPTSDDRVERIAVRRSTSGLTWAMRIAAVIAIVALVGWNLLLQGQLDDTRQYQQGVAAVLDAAQQPGSVAAILTPAGGTGSGIAAITANGDVTMAMRDLAPTSGAEVYEAWAIGADSMPVPIGSFQVGRSGTASMQAASVPAHDGLVLALTAEPGAGATSPTLPIVSKGTATSGH